MVSSGPGSRVSLLPPPSPRCQQPCGHTPALLRGCLAAAPAAPLAALALAPRLEPPSDRSAGRTRSGQRGDCPPREEGTRAAMWHRPREGPKQRHRPFIPGRSPSPATPSAVPLQCPQRGCPGDTRVLAGLAVGPGAQGVTGPTGLGRNQSMNKDMVWGLHVLPAAHRSPLSVCLLRGHRGADRGRVSLCCLQMQEPQHYPELLACRLE